ncbi:MAG: hypothetical protein ACT4PL_05595 [Phycisphaerales bacterium]
MRCSFGRLARWVGLGAFGVCGQGVLGAVPPYALVGSFPLSGDAFDILPDGRVVTISGSNLRVQSGVNSATFDALGSVEPGLVSSFGATFLRISPSGGSIAIGDNNFGPGASVLVLQTAALTTSAATAVAAIAAPNTEAAWADEGTLFVSGFGSGPLLSRIDVGAGVATTVITGIGDGSAGVAIRGGRLFTGVGFDAGGGAATGDIRAFDLAAVSGAMSVPFISGTLVADALSASSLGFDPFGNLFVGGGDFFSGSNDFGYAAVVDGDALMTALSGGVFAPDSAELRLSPAGGGAFYGTRFNAVTNELLVVANGTAFRYAVPGPSAAALGLLGLVVHRRRRA